MGSSNDHKYNNNYSEKWSFEGSLLKIQRQIFILKGKLKFFEENYIINKYMNINILYIKNPNKKEYIENNINLNAELINQSTKISKDQIKYKFLQSKNIEFGNLGYLENGDLIFELMENNKANIIGKIITSKKIELEINLSLKNEFKKNNNI